MSKKKNHDSGKENSEALDDLKNQKQTETTEQTDASVCENKTNEDESTIIKDELAKTKDLLLRQIAEFDNYRKRTSKERLELSADITAKTVLEFLPIVDNIERAVNNECSDPNYKKGIEMIYQSMSETLSKLGVEPIESDNMPFDPNLHKAISKVDAEGKETDVVVTTYEKGYKMGEKVIRFATVVVAN